MAAAAAGAGFAHFRTRDCHDVTDTPRKISGTNKQTNKQILRCRRRLSSWNNIVHASSLLSPPLLSRPTTASFKQQSMSKARVRSPSTGPIVGGILCALILVFGFVVFFRLARHWRTRVRPNYEPELRAKKTVADKSPSPEDARAPMERWSLAHTIIDHTDERRHSNHPQPPLDSKQEDPERPVSPLTATTSSSTQDMTLQAAKPTAWLSATKDAETQSISATTFVTALQSPRASANVT